MLSSAQRTSKQNYAPAVHVQRLPFPFFFKRNASTSQPGLVQQLKTTDVNVSSSWAQQLTDLHLPAGLYQNANALFWVLVSGSRRGGRKSNAWFHKLEAKPLADYSPPSPPLSLTYFGKLCQISKGFREMRSTLWEQLLQRERAVGGCRGGDRRLPLSVGCSQHLLTLTQGFYDSTVTRYVLFFLSAKYLLCILAVLTFLGGSMSLSRPFSADPRADPIALLFICNARNFTC